MNDLTGQTRPLRIFIEIAIFAVLALILKAAFNQVSWKYSGPLSLAALLTILFMYMSLSKNFTLATIGVRQFESAKSWLLAPFQILLTFAAILGSGLLVGMGGEALGLEFMEPDSTRADERFGDLAGNTPLYLSWLAILWFAGPAEEIFFRGYLISRLSQALGGGLRASVLAIFFAAVFFGYGHVYYLGLRGFFMTTAVGLSFGILFLLFRRNLWPLMIGHAAFNSLVFTARYMEWNI